MVKSNTQPAGLKTEPQTATERKWFVLSRVQDPCDRAHLGLDDSWDQLLTLNTEDRAFGEFEWLISRGNMREYLLVAAFPKKKTYYDPIAFDDLDDDVPF